MINEERRFIGAGFDPGRWLLNLDERIAKG